jgi:hypothetical protein
VFTEHGAIMAATILNSPRAVAMSMYVVRTFVKMRRELLGGVMTSTSLHFRARMSAAPLKRMRSLLLQRAV